MKPQATQSQFQLQHDRYVITCDLNFATAMNVYEISLPYFVNNSKIEIDFSQVKQANSAGLALIIEWRKLAQERQITLTFSSIPESIMAIANVADCEGFL